MWSHPVHSSDVDSCVEVSIHDENDQVCTKKQLDRVQRARVRFTALLPHAMRHDLYSLDGIAMVLSLHISHFISQDSLSLKV
jgi:hypothetical protein